MSASWTAPDAVAAKVRRRWDDGTLLRSYGRREAFPVIEVVVRGPKAAEIADDLEAVRGWVSRLDDGQRSGKHYRLEWADIGGRHFGRNRVPSRAVVSSYEQAWALLRVTDEVRRYDEILELGEPFPAAAAWALAHPHRAIALIGEWRGLLAAYAWLDAHRDSDRYLREISAEGVDTKFAERHRGVLSEMLGVSATAHGFIGGLGLRSKPELVRLRPSPALGLALPVTELAVRTDELGALTLHPSRVVVVENEITYLSVSVPTGGAVIWGKGFEVDRVGRLPWLADADVVYWGDLDTHGFAILDRLRTWLPQTRSVLMDRETLLAHQDRWVREDRPSASRLTRLTEDEVSLYEDLVSDRFATKVRLEQERIDWGWVQARAGDPVE